MSASKDHIFDLAMRATEMADRVDAAVARWATAHTAHARAAVDAAETAASTRLSQAYAEMHAACRKHLQEMT